MPVPINGISVAVPVTAAGTATVRTLRPGDLVRAEVKAAENGTVRLLVGREELTARTELLLAAGQLLDLLVEDCTGGVLTLKLVDSGAAEQNPVSSPADLLRGLGLPDTATGRQAVAALLAQRLPLDREKLLILTRAAANPEFRAADFPVLAFLAARDLPLTAESAKVLEELFAGRWLAESDEPMAATEQAAALLERLTLAAGPDGKVPAEKYAGLARAGRELLELLREAATGREGGSSGLRERLEMLRSLNTDTETGWGFLAALAAGPGHRLPLVLAVKAFRRRHRAEGEAEQRLNILLSTTHLGRLCVRLRLQEGALTCRLQVEDAAVQRLADAEGGALAAALRACGYRATVLPCTVGRLDWLAEFWGADGEAAGSVRRVDLTV